jgi:hypothetical protein
VLAEMAIAMPREQRRDQNTVLKLTTELACLGRKSFPI